MDELDNLLDKSRLVTVHGVGGAGKTRTALELGQRRLGRHPDGVWFVELASVDADRVEAEVAAALRVAPDRIETTPLDLDALLVIDSCEHVQEAGASIVERLLRSIPSLRVLATSRAPLGVHGEIVYELEPLGLPASKRSTVDELENTESVQLFVDRARDVDRRFELTNANANAVARIVRQLDGIPLALELAAARVRTIPVDAVQQWGLVALSAYTLLSLLLSGRIVFRLRIALAEHSLTVAKLREEPDEPYRFRVRERTFLLFLLLLSLTAVCALILVWTLTGPRVAVIAAGALMLLGIGWYPVRLTWARSADQRTPNRSQ